MHLSTMLVFENVPNAQRYRRTWLSSRDSCLVSFRVSLPFAGTPGLRTHAIPPAHQATVILYYTGGMELQLC